MQQSSERVRKADIHSAQMLALMDLRLLSMKLNAHSHGESCSVDVDAPVLTGKHFPRMDYGGCYI